MRGCEVGPLQHRGKGLQLPNLFCFEPLYQCDAKRDLLIHVGIYGAEALSLSALA